MTTVAELLVKLTSSEQQHFLDYLECVSPTVAADYSDVQKREAALANQGLTAVVEARRRFRRLHVPFNPPADFHAEMLKPPAHMAKIARREAENQERIEHARAARQRREMLKFGKRVQSMRLAERTQRESDVASAISEWQQKKREGQKGGSDADLDKVLAKAGARKTDATGKKAAVAKRRNKDRRYGLNIGSRSQRKNTSQSTNSGKGFRGGRWSK